MNIQHTNLKDFTIYWEQFQEEMRLRADIIFDEMWNEAHPEKAQ